MLEANADNDLVARLHEFGLLPEDARAQFASGLIDFCVSGTDPAVLWNDQLRSVLTQEEEAILDRRLRRELLSDLRGAVATCTDWWGASDSEDRDPEDAVEPLRSLVRHLRRSHASDREVIDAADRLDRLLDEWVVDHSRSHEEEAPPSASFGSDASASGVVSSPVARSVFDDLLDGRGDAT